MQVLKGTGELTVRRKHGRLVPSYQSECQTSPGQSILPYVLET